LCGRWYGIIHKKNEPYLAIEVRQENNFSLRILPGSSSEQNEAHKVKPLNTGYRNSVFRVWSLGLEFWVGVK